MENTTRIRFIADQAQAENESGVIAGDEVEQAYLDGVEEALRWAVGDGTSTKMRSLVERADAAFTNA